MPTLHLTEDEIRRRNRVVKDGEHVGFDMAFMDAAPRSFLTDAVPDAGRSTYDAACLATGRTPMRRDVSAITAQIQREAQARSAINDAAVQSYVRLASDRRSAGVPRTEQRLLDAGRAARDAALAARYR